MRLKVGAVDERVTKVKGAVAAVRQDVHRVKLIVGAKDGADLFNAVKARVKHDDIDVATVNYLQLRRKRLRTGLRLAAISCADGASRNSRRRASWAFRHGFEQPVDEGSQMRNGSINDNNLSGSRTRCQVNSKVGQRNRHARQRSLDSR